jgi:hypothetical protein
VGPTHFWLDVRTGQLIRAEGRLPIKVKVTKDWETVEGMTSFKWIPND